MGIFYIFGGIYSFILDNLYKSNENCMKNLLNFNCIPVRLNSKALLQLSTYTLYVRFYNQANSIITLYNLNISNIKIIIINNGGEIYMTKKEMLDEMEEAGWSYDTDLDSPYKAVKEDYDEMKKELSDDSLLFPNGRDYDAEDEDGI